jgi:hypothetical protein
MGAIVVLAAASIAAAVSVEGSVSCPTPAEVEARLAPLLASAPEEAGAGGGGDLRVRLHREGGALHVSLAAADGRLLAFRTLEGTHACDALAEAVAVIVAAWRGEVGGRPLLAEPVTGTAGAAELRAAPSAAVAAPVAWGLAMGGGVSLAGDRPGPAAALVATHRPLPGAPWLGRLGVVYQGPREHALSAGHVRWQRWVVELGPAFAAERGWAGWSLHLGPAAALTRLEGRGLAGAQAHDDFALGAGAGARLGARGLNLRPYVELGARGFPTRVVAYEGGAQREAPLPRLEAMLTVGAAIGP